MAENGIISNVLGNNEKEAPEAYGIPEAVGTNGAADAVALGVAMNAARSYPTLRKKAADYLEEQRKLAAEANKRFEEDRKVAQKRDHLAFRAANLKAVSDYLRIALQLVLAPILIFIVICIAFLVQQARTSRSVIVDIFQTPSALASSGITGQVVAAGVLDELQKLQDATRGDSTLVAISAWSSEVKVEVPETGVTFGEIDRLLHKQLSHDIHIDGDLIQIPKDRLKLTVRADGVASQSFSGGAEDLTDLTKKAAVFIYQSSQPYNYLIYLQNDNRDADALAFVPEAYRRASDNALRSRLANGWGNTLLRLNRFAEAKDKYALADSLQDYYWTPRSNLIIPVAMTEGEEAAWKKSKQFLQDAASAPKDQLPALRLSATPAAITWDMPLQERADLENASRHNGSGTASLPDQPVLAVLYAQLHDWATANDYLTRSDPEDPVARLDRALVKVLYAEDQNDAAHAAGFAAEFWKLWLATPQSQAADDSPCVAALALGLEDHTDESDAILKYMDQYNWSRCAAARGQILEHQGKLPAAETAWAEGIDKSPDLPAVYMARGLSEKNRNDVKSAEADFVKANTNAPHFPDQLKLYGDLLAQEGRWKEALAQYDEALTFAPRWPELHRARDEAAKKR